MVEKSIAGDIFFSNCSLSSEFRREESERAVGQRVLSMAHEGTRRLTKLPGCNWVTIYVTCRNKRQTTRETHGADIGVYGGFLFAMDAFVSRGTLLHPGFLYATTTDAPCSQFNAMNFRFLAVFRRINSAK